MGQTLRWIYTGLAQQNPALACKYRNPTTNPHLATYYAVCKGKIVYQETPYSEVTKPPCFPGPGWPYHNNTHSVIRKVYVHIDVSRNVIHAKMAAKYKCLTHTAMPAAVSIAQLPEPTVASSKLATKRRVRREACWIHTGDRVLKCAVRMANKRFPRLACGQVFSDERWCSGTYTYKVNGHDHRATFQTVNTLGTGGKVKSRLTGWAQIG
jgi:hypothetical protein